MIDRKAQENLCVQTAPKSEPDKVTNNGNNEERIRK